MTWNCFLSSFCFSGEGADVGVEGEVEAVVGEGGGNGGLKVERVL